MIIMDNELNFESLDSVKVDDISTLEGMTPEKLDILNSLGVMTTDSYNEKVTSTKETNTDEDESKQEDLNKLAENTVSIKIDTDVDAPNIIIPKAEIIRALRYAVVMIKKVTNDMEASSLNITYKDGKVLYRLKDNMTWVTLTGSCSVSHDKPITKTLTFKTAYITKLLSAATDDLLIYEGTAAGPDGEERQVYYARLINGDYILDVFEGNETKLVPAGNKKDKLSSVPARDISTLCDVMLPLINDTQEVQSKRTIIYEDRAFFRSITYLLQIRNSFTRMCLGKKELDLLKIVCAGAGDIQVDFYSTDSEGENRILIEAPNVVISTSVSVPIRDEVTVSRLLLLENAKYMKVNKDDFNRVLFLSGLGTNTVSRLLMNYCDDGIEARVESNIGNSTLHIAGENYAGLSPRDEAVSIYSLPLSILLKSFEKGKDLEVAFLPEGIAFRDKTLGVEAIMNYSS